MTQNAEESRDALMVEQLSAAGKVGHIVICHGVLSDCIGPLFPLVIFFSWAKQSLYSLVSVEDSAPRYLRIDMCGTPACL